MAKRVGRIRDSVLERWDGDGSGDGGEDCECVGCGVSKLDDEDCEGEDKGGNSDKGGCGAIRANRLSEEDRDMKNGDADPCLRLGIES